MGGGKNNRRRDLHDVHDVVEIGLNEVDRATKLRLRAERTCVGGSVY